MRALDLLYPRRAVCVGCGEKSGCAASELCESCLTRLTASKYGAHPTPPNSALDQRAHAYRYAGVAGAVVRALKYQNVRVLAPQMAADMAEAARSAGILGNIDCIVCVPMHFWRKYRRGMNQSELLAREIAGNLGIPYIDALRRTRHTRQQARLTVEQRRRNLDGAFRASIEVKGKSVLLIDDVYTTGTTARRCAGALKQAGAAQVALLTYAMT